MNRATRGVATERGRHVADQQHSSPIVVPPAPLQAERSHDLVKWYQTSITHYLEEHTGDLTIFTPREVMITFAPPDKKEPGRKERALLALLAMPPGEPRSRDRLCGLLWGDRGDKQAHDSLKQAVHRLRSSFT